MTTADVPDDARLAAILANNRAPTLPEALVADHLRRVYGLEGRWQKLGGEREQNFRLRTVEGLDLVVKIAAPTEPVEGLNFQLGALRHLALCDPTLTIPRVQPTLSGAEISFLHTDGQTYPLRVLTFLPGQILLHRVEATGTPLTDAELETLGAAAGRLARGLRGYPGRGAPRDMPWDLANGLLFSDSFLRHLPNQIAGLVATLLPRLQDTIRHALPRLRAQVIYNDFHESNALVSEGPDLSVVGVIDFGDMIFGPVAQDVAVAVASLVHWTDDPLRAAGALVRGYQRFVTLDPDDLAVLKDLILARLILQVGMVAHHTEVQGRQDIALVALQDLYMAAIRRFADTSDATFLSALSGHPPIATPDLIQRREAVLGKTYTFYEQPLHLVRGRGCHVYDAAGAEYLDCYNNVANLGHCHPHVVQVLTRQASTLNTNSRYLHDEIIRLGERLKATLPPSLDTIMFVCTGSEANDMAVRLSRAATGKTGVIVTEKSYHGNTTTVAPLSLIDYDARDKPDWVATVPPPNLYRGLYRDGANDAGASYASHIPKAVAELDRAGQGAAALLIDSIFDANGALVPPPDYLDRAYAEARAAGALVIADEVQMGFARSGTHMWGFQAFGVVPDIVTMGKPMGNGHPIAAVATRRDLAELVQKRTGYFNTFGGNTVSAAVGNACLDVLQGEDLQGNALRSGTHLRDGLLRLQDQHPVIGHIQGRGLFLGVELVTDRDTRAPAKRAARWVRERMKALGVLVTSTGPLGNIIKIRPPLVFSTTNADRCLAALSQALTDLPASLRHA